MSKVSGRGDFGLERTPHRLHEQCSAVILSACSRLRTAGFSGGISPGTTIVGLEAPTLHPTGITGVIRAYAYCLICPFVVVPMFTRTVERLKWGLAQREH